MTMTERMRDKGWNLNSVLILFGIIGGIISAVLFFAPLETLPNDVRSMQGDMNDVKRTQAVQTEAIKTLADVTKDNREIRRDLDKHAAESGATMRRQDAEIEGVKRRLDRLEAR